MHNQQDMCTLSQTARQGKWVQKIKKNPAIHWSLCCSLKELVSQEHKSVFFPGNCTSQLQPLDVGVIHAFTCNIKSNSFERLLPWYVADSSKMYEGWNFNFGNAALTFDTAHLQNSYFHRPSMYAPKLCRTHSQWWGSRMMPLAAPVLLMVRTEQSAAEGLNPPCNCPIR